MSDAFEIYESQYGYEEWDWERYKAPEVRESKKINAPVGEDIRPPFARDHDRLLYTSAFRRLQGKTQVVTPGQADFFHTRLTHTMEVVQVARRMAEYLNHKSACQLEIGQGDGQLRDWRGAVGWVDPDVCEAAAVLHDLGHPPFGHAGELALGKAVKEAAADWSITEPVGGFEGNAQSFRMATRSLAHKAVGEGLQLTRAVLDAGLKYPWEHLDPNAPDSDRKWGVYPTEFEAFRWLRDGRVPVHLLRQKTVEAQIMDWSDDVAYSIHDIDDWFRAGFMPIADLARGGQALKNLQQQICQRRGLEDRVKIDQINQEIGGLFEHGEAFAAFRGSNADVANPRSDTAHEAIRSVRSFMFDQFTTAVELGVREGADASWPRRYALELRVDERIAAHNKILRDLLWIYVVGSHHMATHQTGQAEVVRRLMKIHADAAKAPTKEQVEIFPDDVRELLRSGDDKVARLRLVADYVSAMTDSYAERAHARLTGAGTPFYEYL